MGQVYPRVYGESPAPAPVRSSTAGLSPRVRGIRYRSVGGLRRRGSIPACTGNPGVGPPGTRYKKVYPRVYGESLVAPDLAREGRGLSPRVRGIRRPRNQVAPSRGSIPACTGNPRRMRQPQAKIRVYPRVYGESSASDADTALVGGLSPRVRGIHVCGDRGVSAGGSIPACTGNPSDGRISNWHAGVYPRVYGESQPGSGALDRRRGLSPRVRGILIVNTSAAGTCRSIPACTGNPVGDPRQRRPHLVYPRVYGESEPV